MGHAGDHSSLFAIAAQLVEALTGGEDEDGGWPQSNPQGVDGRSSSSGEARSEAREDTASDDGDRGHFEDNVHAAADTDDRDRH